MAINVVDLVLGRFCMRVPCREREAIAFSSRVKPAFQGAITVPQPFKLSGDAEAAARRQRLVEEQQAREMRECTFAPRTAESLNRELLATIIREDDAWQ